MQMQGNVGYFIHQSDAIRFVGKLPTVLTINMHNLQYAQRILLSEIFKLLCQTQTISVYKTEQQNSPIKHNPLLENVLRCKKHFIWNLICFYLLV